jgi:hypothetical protein
MSAMEQRQAELELLDRAAEILRAKMELGRIPLIVMGSGVSAGVFAPTMLEVHEYLVKQIEEKKKAFEISGQKFNHDEQRLIETILALLHQLTAPKPAIWKGEETPDSPRSVQVWIASIVIASIWRVQKRIGCSRWKCANIFWISDLPFA